MIYISNDANLIPFDQMNLFKRVSIRTSFVPICCSANLRISLTALGARFLNPILCNRLCILMVYTLVTTSDVPLDFSRRVLAILFYQPPVTENALQHPDLLKQNVVQY